MNKSRVESCGKKKKELLSRIWFEVTVWVRPEIVSLFFGI